MKTKIKLLLITALVLAVMGCAHGINTISENYAETSQAVKDFAKISAQDWLFGSGVIQGALPEDNLPSWVYDELQKVDAWCESGEVLTEHQLGYTVGLRLRLAGPIIRAAIEQYAPVLLNIPEVVLVLSFIGL